MRSSSPPKSSERWIGYENLYTRSRGLLYSYIRTCHAFLDLFRLIAHRSEERLNGGATFFACVVGGGVVDQSGEASEGRAPSASAPATATSAALGAIS